MKTREPGEKHHIRRIPIYAQVIIVAIGVLLFLSVCFLCFQIREVRVVGNYLYTEEQIMEASGISKGENLAVIQKAKTAGMILKNLPFIDRVHIERILPDQVVIYVSEAESSFTVKDKWGNYFLVSDGIIGEKMDMLAATGYPEVKGLNLLTLKEGENLTSCVQNPDAVSEAVKILSILDSYGVTGGLKSINVEVLIDISMNYGDCYDVYFGDMNEIDRKIAYFVAILQSWGMEKTGMIDLTFDAEDNPRFQPYE